MSRRYWISEPMAQTVIPAVLDAAGWQRTEGDDDWDATFTAAVGGPATLGELRPGRFANHFPGIRALTRKDGLALTMARARRWRPGDFDFTPVSFVLPEQYDSLMQAGSERPAAWWVRKPRGGAKGREVHLLDDVWSLECRSEVVQEYIARPHLIEGRKYTLRWYVLIASVDPLVVYAYDDGFTKFASRRFRDDPDGRADRFVHLTNPDIQALNPDVPTSAFNLVRADYVARLRDEGIDADGLLRAMETVIAKAVAAAREQVAAETTARASWAAGCFELLGVDITVDADLRPWLIECNQSPSLTVEASPVTDKAREESDLKHRMVADALRIAGLTGERPDPTEAEVGGFRRIFPSASHPEAWPCLTLPRLEDLELARAVGVPVGCEPSVRPAPGSSVSELAGSLVLHGAAADVEVLNDTAAFVWSALEEGLARGSIVDEMVAAFGHVDGSAIGADVDALLGRWIDEGRLVRADEEAAPPAPERRPMVCWNRQRSVAVAGVVVAVDEPCDSASPWIEQALRSLGSDGEVGPADVRVEVRVRNGRWAVDGTTCRTGPELVDRVRRRALARGVDAAAGPVLAATLLGDGGEGVLVLGPMWLRRAVIDGWVGGGGTCLGDDLAWFCEDGRMGGQRIGFERRIGAVTWDGMDEGDPPLLLGPDGRWLSLDHPVGAGAADPVALRSVLIATQEPADADPVLLLGTVLAARVPDGPPLVSSAAERLVGFCSQVHVEVVAPASVDRVLMAASFRPSA